MVYLRDELRHTFAIAASKSGRLTGLSMKSASADPVFWDVWTLKKKKQELSAI